MQLELTLGGFAHPSRVAAGWVPPFAWLWERMAPNAVPLEGFSTSADKSEVLPVERPRDTEDIQAALAGDGEAYARLVQHYQNAVGAMMWRFTRDRRAWEELVHDVFVEAYFSLPTFKSRAPFEHWLKRIATRTGYRYWKSQARGRREESLEEEVSFAAANPTDPNSDAAELVHHLLAQLAPRDRLVMTLAYLEQRTTTEIAELTGWSKSLVKVQIHRARRRLAKICEKQGIEL